MAERDAPPVKHVDEVRNFFKRTEARVSVAGKMYSVPDAMRIYHDNKEDALLKRIAYLQALPQQTPTPTPEWSDRYWLSQTPSPSRFRPEFLVAVREGNLQGIRETLRWSKLVEAEAAYMHFWEALTVTASESLKRTGLETISPQYAADAIKRQGGTDMRDVAARFHLDFVGEFEEYMLLMASRFPMYQTLVDWALAYPSWRADPEGLRRFMLLEDPESNLRKQLEAETTLLVWRHVSMWSRLGSDLLMPCPRLTLRLLGKDKHAAWILEVNTKTLEAHAKVQGTVERRAYEAMRYAMVDELFTFRGKKRALVQLYEIAHGGFYYEANARKAQSELAAEAAAYLEALAVPDGMPLFNQWDLKDVLPMVSFNTCYMGALKKVFELRARNHELTINAEYLETEKKYRALELEVPTFDAFRREHRLAGESKLVTCAITGEKVEAGQAQVVHILKLGTNNGYMANRFLKLAAEGYAKANQNCEPGKRRRAEIHSDDEDAPRCHCGKTAIVETLYLCFNHRRRKN